MECQKTHEKMFNITHYLRNANQTSMRCHITPARMAITKKSRDNKCWEGMEKKEPYHTAGGNVNWCMWRLLRKLKKELPFDPTIPFLGICPEKTMTPKDTCTPMLIAALFAIAKTWTQPKCALTEAWIKKRWHIYTMEYYSAIKRNKIIAFLARWMDLEIIMLSEVSQTMRYQHQMLSLTCGI